MKTFADLIRLFVVASIVYVPFLTLRAQDNSSVSGTWRGTWSAPEGYVYLAEMHLRAGSGSTLDGEIKWTLKKSPRETEQAKVGLTGVEFIRGSFDSQCRILALEGYEKKDPNNILGLDKYKLMLAENEKVIAGFTSHRGSWTSVFSLERVERRSQ